MLFRITSVVLVCLLSTSVAQCQESVVEIDFDTFQTENVSSYVFGGYGPADGSDVVTIDDKLSSKQSQDASNGRSDQLAEAEDELAKAKSSYTDKHPKVVELQEKVDKLRSLAIKCSKLVFDTSAAKIPGGAAYDYAGVGLGVTLNMTGKSIAPDSLKSYSISFDAKVAGTKPLSQSKMLLQFVTADGDDEDDQNDIVLDLRKGQDDGVGTFEINSEYQTFSYSLDTLNVTGGKVADLKDAKLTGINVIVQAQGNMSDFGTDKDNVLYVDNVRLIKK